MMSDTPETPQKDQPAVVISPQTLSYGLVAVVFFVVGVLVGAIAFGNQNSTDIASIEQALRNVLADANIGTPQDRFAFVDDDPYLGDINAPIVMVEFGAYGCVYCKQYFDDTFHALIENYGQYIRYVYRDMPTTNPDISFPSAIAAECADQQGKFWEYHENLFANVSTLGQEQYLTTATQLGLDMADFTSCIASQQAYDEVNHDYFDGILEDVTGTPTFFINGEKYSGAQSYAFFESIILAELVKAGINIES
jgi:protein-disulfide isomerase